MSQPAVWVHDAAISPEDVALRANPDAAVVFVFDEPRLRAEPPAFHRLDFVFAGVRELFAAVPHAVKEVRVGDPFAEIVAFCREHGRDEVHVTDHPEPRTREVIDRLKAVLPVRVYPRGRLTDYAEEPRRFSRYWEKVGRQVLGHPPRSGREHHK